MKTINSEVKVPNKYRWTIVDRNGLKKASTSKPYISEYRWVSDSCCDWFYVGFDYEAAKDWKNSLERI